MKSSQISKKTSKIAKYHKLNIYSKQWLYNEGIIKEYNNLKDKYYKKIEKIKNDLLE